MKVVWLDSAVDDVVRLRAFIQQHNPTAAAKAAQRLIEAAKLLEAHPNLGKPVDTLPSYRDLGIRFGASGYVLRYRIHDDVVYVAHIRHYRESGF